MSHIQNRPVFHFLSAKHTNSFWYHNSSLPYVNWSDFADIFSLNIIALIAHIAAGFGACAISEIELVVSRFSKPLRKEKKSYFQIS